MNDAELQGGHLIWALFSMPLQVDRRGGSGCGDGEVAWLGSQRKPKVKASRTRRRLLSPPAVIAALFLSVGEEDGGPACAQGGA